VVERERLWLGILPSSLANVEANCGPRSEIHNLVLESVAEEDFVEEKGGDSFGSDGFLSGAENYPLSKAMVYHDQERIEASGGGEVGD